MEALSPLSSRFADFICRLAGTGSAELHRAAAMASRAVEDGQAWAEVDGVEWSGSLEALREFPVVGAPGEFTPLVLDESGRLYLYRYWKYQHDLFLDLDARAASTVDDFDPSLLEEGIDRLFPGMEDDDRQVAAARAAASGRLCVMTGGPGTGKTWTAVRALALLIDQARARGVVLRSVLAAPTGKAVARLSQTVSEARTGLDLPAETLDRIPDHGYTIHRLLGSRAGSSSFRHDADNPLPFDVVVVDEASMVDLALMSRLVGAMPPDARLILLGDRHQLASVEPGRVFGDLCSLVHGGCVVELLRNYRFAPDSGIALLAEAVKSSRVSVAMDLLKDDSHPDVSLVMAPAPADLESVLTGPVLKAWAGCLETDDPGEALGTFDHFRILCALRRGPYGIINLNAACESILERSGLIHPTPSGRFRGRPILVTRNDYALGLFNGDSGILWPDPSAGGELTACFPCPDGGTRRIHPARLPPHETCWAMTVHKSQGSEFDSVLLILPDRESPVVTRELLYTAVTRACRNVVVMGGDLKKILQGD